LAPLRQNKGRIFEQRKAEVIAKFHRECPLKTPALSAIEKQIKEAFSIDRLLAHFVIETESHVVKKNNRPIFRRGRGRGKTFLGKTDRLINAEGYYLLEMTKQAATQGAGYPIDFPIWVIFLFYFSPTDYFTKKGQISLTLPDLSNLYQLPEDCLQKAGVIKNDSLIHSHDLSRRLVSDKPRLEIFILKHNTEESWKSHSKNL